MVTGDLILEATPPQRASSTPSEVLSGATVTAPGWKRPAKRSAAVGDDTAVAVGVVVALPSLG